MHAAEPAAARVFQFWAVAVELTVFFCLLEEDLRIEDVESRGQIGKARGSVPVSVLNLEAEGAGAAAESAAGLVNAVVASGENFAHHSVPAARHFAVLLEWLFFGLTERVKEQQIEKAVKIDFAYSISKGSAAVLASLSAVEHELGMDLRNPNAPMTVME